MTIKIVVKWDICYDRDGGINFWAKNGNRMRKKSGKVSQKR